MSDIEILGRETEGAERFGDERERIVRERVPVEVLRDQLDSFLAGMDEALETVRTTVGGFTVDEITLTLDVSAKGSVRLFGAGGELGGSGGISVTLRRRAEGS